jgi:hypothetical protein
MPEGEDGPERLPSSRLPKESLERFSIVGVRYDLGVEADVARERLGLGRRHDPRFRIIVRPTRHPCFQHKRSGEGLSAVTNHDVVGNSCVAEHDDPTVPLATKTPAQATPERLHASMLMSQKQDDEQRGGDKCHERHQPDLAELAHGLMIHDLTCTGHRLLPDPVELCTCCATSRLLVRGLSNRRLSASYPTQ